MDLGDKVSKALLFSFSIALISGAVIIVDLGLINHKSRLEESEQELYGLYNQVAKKADKNNDGWTTGDEWDLVYRKLGQTQKVGEGIILRGRDLTPTQLKYYIEMYGEK